MKLKIGILGGLFDPPHFGHLIVAQRVLEEFGFDKIIFIPAFNPPHKARYSPFDVRCRMVRLAIRNNRNFFLSDIEKTITGKTYTIEVVRRLKNRLLGPKKQWLQPYLIIGADQWNEIETWRSPGELIRECKIIVVPRPGYRINRQNFRGKKLLISSSPLIDISSTVIRDRIRRKMPVGYYVPPAVLSYINKSRLYR